MARRMSSKNRDRAKRERRSGVLRRSGRDRRGGDVHDLYQTDLDRHFWTFPRAESRRRKRAKRKRSVKRRIARVVAGSIGVAGLAYYLYRRSRGDVELRAQEAENAPRGTAGAGEEEEAGV